MRQFKSRELAGSKLLGERLREMRLEYNLSIEEFAERVEVPAKHVRALEAGEYSKLPGDVYVKNFLRKIAKAFGVETQRVLLWYERERDVAGGFDERIVKPMSPPQEIHEGFSVSPRIVRMILMGLAALAVAVYLIWQVQQFFRAPDLIVTSPEQNLTTIERSVIVEGQSEPEAEVRVNDREIPVDRQGVFRDRVNLRTGVNTITITAKRGRSATAVEQRLIFVEEAQE